MKQYTAVKKLMLTIKIINEERKSIGYEELIPEELFPIIREYFKQMYAAGYDEARCLNNYKRKMIGQFDESGKFINSFSSRTEASRKTKFPVSSIWRSMAEERPVRGFLWKYL